ncbi:MAG: ABC transporter permease subunit [Actinobacteria bacterium]|jgi:putative spermidine/putrescine transport system permease protein|nr:ABC transporter permease subunit [Actinomycetota bacterium]NBR66923.1 ABC transporter permease subunit [Actinomycetota bacterium]NBU16344.1 ABC transporter permease subunit [Actinomycetota bacterium]
MSEFEPIISSYPLNGEFSPGSRLPGVPGTPNRKGRSGLVPLLPFFGCVTAFLLLPTFALFMRAARPVDGADTPALVDAVSGEFRGSFIFSLRISAASALGGAVVGFLLALAVTRVNRPHWVKKLFVAFSGVAANLGGIPLAFAFTAALGAQGLITRILYHWGIDLYGNGFRISSSWGIVVVYLYFQIPLMVLVMLPAIEGLKPEWAEASAVLGAGGTQYWRLVGLPVLAPSIFGGLLLLFANAFSAYATAYALSSGASDLVPVQIRFFLQGNTITGKGNLGYALAAWMIVVLALAMGAYLVLRRRAERWR